MTEQDLQYHSLVLASVNNTTAAQQMNRQSSLPCLESTHTQAQKAREAARFDAFLEEILRQKEAARELAAREDVTKGRREPAEDVDAAEEADVAEEEDAVEADSDRLQWSDQASMTLGQSFPRAQSCNHQGRWADVPGRSRCEWHRYSEKGYRNPFRSQCPKCKTFACGLCRKRLKRGDML